MKFYSSFRKMKKSFSKEKKYKFNIKLIRRSNTRVMAYSKVVTGQVMRIIACNDNLNKAGYINQIGLAYLQGIGIKIQTKNKGDNA